MGLLRFLRSKCKVGFQLCFFKKFCSKFCSKINKFLGKRNFKFLIKKTECMTFSLFFALYFEKGKISKTATLLKQTCP